VLLPVLVAGLLGSCAVWGATGTAAVHAQQAVSSTVWLCRPGLADNPCESDLATTIIRPDGSKRVVDPRPAKHPPIDCFYVYPTVSGQPGPNATLGIDPEVRAVAETQASRFSQVCRVYAPVYRQLTVATIRNPGAATTQARVTAYLDVQNAWHDYLEHDNHGRGVVFVGHSQGALMLTALLRREVDPNPSVRKQVVSALLIGANVTVAAGQDGGGSFQHIPACRAAKQDGCVVAYSSFSDEPPADARFGRAGQGASVPADDTATALEVLCVNPAAPAGGTGPLLPFFRTTPFPGPLGGNRPSRYQAATPWVEQPRLYTARCEQRDGAGWLQIDDTVRARDDRPRVQASLGPSWGLHLVDVGLTLGNLVTLVRAQTAAYSASQNAHTEP
jgi:hypothetical protein